MLTFFHFPSSSSFLFLGPDVLTKESLTIPWGMQHRFLHQIRTLQSHYSSFSKVFSKFEYSEKETKIWKKTRASPDVSNIVFYRCKIWRSTNPETPKDQLFISNCFEIGSLSSSTVGLANKGPSIWKVLWFKKQWVE